MAHFLSSTESTQHTSSAVARLHSERAALQECADIEMLDCDHAVLIVRPGAAWRLAS
jgi:hypothetical protein